MNQKLKVKDSPSLIRDSYSKAVLNTDLNKLREYKEKKLNQKKLVDLKDDIANLKSDIEQIKSMLAQLINK